MPRFLILLLYNLLYPPALLLMAPGALRKMKARGGKVVRSPAALRILQRGGKARNRRAAVAGPRVVDARRERRRSRGCGEAHPRTRAARWRARHRALHDHAHGFCGGAQARGGTAGPRAPDLQSARSLVHRAPLSELDQAGAPGAGRGRSVAEPRLRRAPSRHRSFPGQRPALTQVGAPLRSGAAAGASGVFHAVACLRAGAGGHRALGEARCRARSHHPLRAASNTTRPGRASRWNRSGSLESCWKKPAGARTIPSCLAASTHAGEETGIAKVFMQSPISDLPSSVSSSSRVTPSAPQKSKRNSVDAGLTVARRSTLGVQHPASGIVSPDVLLVDATGELRAWQHHATAVVVGKSFLGTGGQNPAEAITAGKPVFFGPHMENFAPLVRQLLASRRRGAGGGFRGTGAEAGARLAGSRRSGAPCGSRRAGPACA